MLSGPGTETEPLIRVALRDNPRRRQLLVSRVLGKHIPARPPAIRGAATQLAECVGAALAQAGIDPTVPLTVLGFAETATSLSECVAETLRATRSGHSTRYAPPDAHIQYTFVEEHSHASDHAIVAGVVPQVVPGARPDSVIVLVDDELTTGRTALNVVQEIARAHPHSVFMIAALLDARSPQAGRAMRQRMLALDVCVLVCALTVIDDEQVSAAVDHFGTLSRAAPPRPTADHPGADRPAAASTAVTIDAQLPVGMTAGARSGWSRVDRLAAIAQSQRVSQVLGAALGAMLAARPGASVADSDILVLGTEEFQYFPLHVAAALDAMGTVGRVWSSSTTRSPGLVLDEPGYGLRSGIRFVIDVPGSAQSVRFAYNVAAAPTTDRPFDAIIVCCDDVVTAAACRGTGGLVQSLATLTEQIVLVQFISGGRS